MTSEGCKCSCLVKWAVAIGLTWAIWVFLAGLFAMHGYGVPVVHLMSSVYLGYAASFKGSLLGALWGFVDVFIFVIIVGLIYCLIAKCCGKYCPKCCKKNGSCKPEEPVK